jgi:hypothetical protein
MPVFRFNNTAAKLRKSALADKAYLAAIESARDEVTAGRALAYLTGYRRDIGRYIEVLTDQGWNPDRFWEEFPLEPWEE